MHTVPIESRPCRLHAMARLLLRITAAASLAGVAPLAGAQCAGFTDVTPQDQFCNAVDWIKNRGVTQGCGGTNYCPGQSVIRIHMAAFMNRLGDAMTPIPLRVDVSPGAIDVDAGAVVCQTGPTLLAGYPRRALLDLTFSAQAAADVDIAADLVQTTNGGATWVPLTTVGNRGFVPANRWGTLSNLAVSDLDAGTTVQFGVRVTRVTGSADLTDSRCNLRVAIGSRTGTASPF